MEPTYVRKGFGLKREIEPELATYHSHVVTRLQEAGYALTVGDLTFRLAREFGFCYGVDRAVEYAYESRKKFPDRRLYLVGEIIHNPHVNARLRDLGVTILGYDPHGAFDFSAIRPEDVVLMPAFGVTVQDFERLGPSSVVVDTTCRSVLNVEARRALREGRIHVGGPREALPRGDESHGQPGDPVRGWEVPDPARHGRGGDRLPLHRARGQSR
jgi:4-hydroxy-3-methylbut-2-enyl diphosphate reductase